MTKCYLTIPLTPRLLITTPKGNRAETAQAEGSCRLLSAVSLMMSRFRIKKGNK